MGSAGRRFERPAASPWHGRFTPNGAPLINDEAEYNDEPYLSGLEILQQ
jgi:hypothetical protein